MFVCVCVSACPCICASVCVCVYVSAFLCVYACLRKKRHLHLLKSNDLKLFEHVAIVPRASHPLSLSENAITNV